MENKEKTFRQILDENEAIMAEVAQINRDLANNLKKAISSRIEPPKWLLNALATVAVLDVIGLVCVGIYKLAEWLY